MHQLGLLRIVRFALVFIAAVLVAAQLYSFLGSGDDQGSARAAPLDMMPATWLDWPSLVWLDLERLGVVWFDGAAPLPEGDADPDAPRRVMAPSIVPVEAPQSAL
ncbi:MAG: hypothetical protein AAF675_01915 [Pseudomonadota bacterium]